MVIKNLKQSRENLDIKQKELAELFGVHYTTISGWETGKDTIPIRRLIEYANTYKLSLDYLFGLTKYNDNSYLPIHINLDIIAKNLKKYRKNNNMTQDDVAKRINTSQANYAHYENSVNLIPTTFIYNLSKIYDNFSIDELFGRKK